MTNIEKIIDIITKKKGILYSQEKAEDDLIFLLKGLEESDKKQLKPKILKLMRQYNRDMFRVEGADDKYRLASTAGFVLLSYNEFKSHWGMNFDRILQWYCPKWFSEYYNNDQWFALGYERMLEYMKKSYIQPRGDKIAKELVELEEGKNSFETITLQKHIWTLFEYESEVHLTKRYPKFGKIEWGAKLVELANEKKIDRKKLLQECLLTTTRNFNKVAVGFFWDIFESLHPTKEELLQLQSSFHLVLQSQYSKPINQTLKYFKQIHKEQNFDIEGFIEQVSLLLSWHIKAVVNQTLALIDVLIKEYPEHKDKLAILATQALAQEDDSLQIKTIKLLLKHKLLENQDLLDEIALYADGLYHSTKEMLPKLDNTSIEEEMLEIVPPQYIREDNRITYPKSFDEMVFFFSQVFEGNSVYDFDLFLTLLPRLKNEIKKENINYLEPALQRAFKYFKQFISSEQPYSHMLLYASITFIRYLIPLYKQFPTLKNQAQIYNEALKEAEVGFYGSYLDRFEAKKLTAKSSEISRHLLHQLLSNNMIPLSTPTHSPCWIALDTFIERVSNVEIEQIDTFDFELALGRTIGNSADVDLSRLDKELQHLVEYTFGSASFDLSIVKQPRLWLGALLRKKDINAYRMFLAHFGISDIADNAFEIEWRAYLKPWEYETWENGVKVKKQTTSAKLTLMQHRYIEKLPFETLYKHTNASIDNGVLPKYDDSYYFCMTPLSVHPFSQSLLLVLSKDYESAFGKRCANNAIMTFSDIWAEEHPSNYLLLAYAMVYFDKTVRILSSELWYKATLEGTMDHQLLGKTLGKLEENGYAPLKRFSDLVISNMLNISKLHNTALYTLLSTMIAHMNDVPIKGTKKLLEIYLEVLNLTKLDMPASTAKKLEIWKNTNSLKSVCFQIL
jgi:hypothetical protein